MTIVIEFEDPVRSIVNLPQYKLWLNSHEYKMLMDANVLAPHHIVAGEDEVIK